ncbi:MAG TPA: ATP-binding protein, partial [Clostridia bacterium]|nr:ATP-binding protein [Clostridia bacterium]
VLDDILHSTIQRIQEGKGEIDEISSQINEECEKLKKDLQEIGDKVNQIIKKVDSFQYKEKLARYELFITNRDFQSHSEAEMKNAYNAALELRDRYLELQQQERLLRQERDKLTRRYRKLSATAKRAQNLSAQIADVISYLAENLKGMSGYVKKLQGKDDMVIAIIRAQEEERKSIAREIHDGPAQAISNVVIRAEICKQLGIEKPELLEELEGLVATANNSLEDIRRIIFNLRPMHLDDLGLIYAVNKYCDDFEKRTGIRVLVKHTGCDRRFDDTHEISIYRIIQEILNNARKHSRADTIEIDFNISPLVIGVTVSDNGIGFDPEGVDYTKHFGLKGIKERVNLMEGSIRIDSAKDRGTTFYIEIPFS